MKHLLAAAPLLSTLCSAQTWTQLEDLPGIARDDAAAFSIGSIGMGVLVYIAVGLLLPEETLVDVEIQNAKLQDVQVVDGTVIHNV